MSATSVFFKLYGERWEVRWGVVIIQLDKWAFKMHLSPGVEPEELQTINLSFNCLEKNVAYHPLPVSVSLPPTLCKGVSTIISLLGPSTLSGTFRNDIQINVTKQRLHGCSFATECCANFVQHKCLSIPGTDKGWNNESGQHTHSHLFPPFSPF